MKSVNELNPEKLVLVECGELSLELSAQALIDNGYGDRELANQECAGPFLAMSGLEFEDLFEKYEQAGHN